MIRSNFLMIDAVVNFLLGILLLLLVPFPGLSQVFGIPSVDFPFYASIMGGVFIGIGIALVIETKRKKLSNCVGLGLSGAVAINLCGGGVLLAWLIFGKINFQVRGYVFLWTLVLLLVGLSILEGYASVKE